MFTANNSVVSLLGNVTLVAGVLMFRFYNYRDFLIYCIPHIILYNIITICIASVIYKTNAYIFILSTELCLKMKHFNTALKSLKQVANQHQFSANLYKTIQWFIYMLTVSRNYNLFWVWQFSILIIWRSMVITFISYILFFNELPVMAKIMYSTMWTMEQLIFLLLLIQVTNVVSIVKQSSRSLRNATFSNNAKCLNTRLKVCMN